MTPEMKALLQQRGTRIEELEAEVASLRTQLADARKARVPNTMVTPSVPPPEPPADPPKRRKRGEEA